MSCAGGPPTNFSPRAQEEDDDMRDNDDDTDSDMKYSPASPGEPMSVQQLTAATEPPGTEVAACPRGPSSRGAPGDPGCKGDLPWAHPVGSILGGMQSAQESALPDER